MSNVESAPVANAVRPATMEEHFAVQQFLHQEARMLDQHDLRRWIDTVVHPDIAYRMVIRPELLERDALGEGVWIYDDNFAALEMRVQQAETGLQKMLDPRPRISRMLTNIEVFHDDKDGSYKVNSYGLAARFRREYEEELLFFKRYDVLTDRIDELRVKERLIDLPKRVFTGKNLLIFL